MAGNDGEKGRTGLTRREMIKRAAIVGGAAVWAAPVIRMAIGSGGGGPATRSLDGARLAAFEAPCANSLLRDPVFIATVCAKTQAAAETAFRAQADTACTARCDQLGPCVTGVCEPRPGRLGNPIIPDIVCVGPGADCPAPPYASNTKEFVCTAVVTCRCECR